ncbi:MAG: DEAD/DEAH box helicase [Rhodobacteraceae bacterium]|nr:DEAD/DEAH box helicase [Paracoccaceae bacterium]
MTDFQNVLPTLAAALNDRGYEKLTPVQLSVLNDAPQNADLLVSAQTGSGKTVAFGLALAPTLLGEDDTFGAPGAPVALAIAPTRELALQVKEELTWLYDKAKAVTASCVGGMDPRAERRHLTSGVHIVVGTPGRLRDHIERRALDLSQIKAIVLDEADEMLDMGFREDLEFILGSAPDSRRTLMFSATVSRPIAELAKRFQNDAVRLSTINTKEQHGDIQYIAHPVAPKDRENAIINVLRLHESEKSIVFCSTREAVNRLTSRLANRGFAIVSLSGELSQEQRSSSLQAMKDGRARVCVATDVAARGIDLPNLDLVIHADLPTGKEPLLHRSGRTGRAGRKGTCVLMVPFPRRRQAIRLLSMARIDAKWVGAPTADEIRAKDRERLLSDPVLSAPVEDEEATVIKELAEQYSAEQLAAAFVKLRQAKLPSPEEIGELGSEQLSGNDVGSRHGRSAEISGKFEDGIWFSLSVGHKHRADPRWLLPMICKAGNVTKRDVGAIKIYQGVSYFEISGKLGESFAGTVKKEGTGEKNVNISRLDVKPGELPTAPKEEFTPRGGPKGRGRRGDAPDYESMGREDRMRGPRRGPKNFSAGEGKPPARAKKRRRFEDDDAPATHPAYEPMDPKAVARDFDGDKPPRSSKPKEARADGPRKFKGAKAGPKSGKPKKGGKPSRSERKSAKASS